MLRMGEGEKDWLAEFPLIANGSKGPVEGGYKILGMRECSTPLVCICLCVTICVYGMLTKEYYIINLSISPRWVFIIQHSSEEI